MIYLDYAATFPVYTDIIKKLPSIFNQYDFNPSAVYAKGVKTKLFLSDLRNKLSFYLNINSDHLFFTGSATESLNTIIKGLNYKQRNKIIVWNLEHKAVLAPVKRLEQYGVEVIYINTGRNSLTFDSIRPYLDSNVRLVSLMHVNNETGCINNINDIARKIKEIDKDILIMSDMAQSFCKIDVSLENIDFAAMSAHKVGGMKGCGLLYASKPEILTPLIEGGGQEKGIRSGTENPAAIFSLVDASITTIKKYKEGYNHLYHLNQALHKRCIDRRFSINSPESSVPFIFNFSTGQLPSEVLINHLSSKDIYVSSASACSGRSKSSILKQMGNSDIIVDTAIRVSLNPDTTLEDIEFFMNEVDIAIKELSF